ncbi:MAG: ABC transporter substrate-binding protein [Acidobacteriia bacterium]|nr:ABC transporter substrate-binding protein [Terriglobia bacterium]
MEPKEGGTLRVQLSERLTTIDPRQLPSNPMQAAAAERVDSLLFDRLVRFDDHGALQPALALSWQHDAQWKRWQFVLRKGVKFSDGSPFTTESAALAIQQLLGNAFDVSATDDSIVILADHSLQGLPAMLAQGRFFIFRTANEGSLLGTGPFLISIWPVAGAEAKLALTANESCWAGRPFVDKIEITMGVDPQQQANAIAFGQADVVDLPAPQVRREAQRGVRTVSSDPVDLFALQFVIARPGAQDARVRQAISLAIDRASIADVILQRQGVVAGGLLPNWISGYAHLFPATMDTARAKELLAAAREVSHPTPLVLVYDSVDGESRAVADRVAVNLKEAGIAVQVSGRQEATKMASADIRLVRRRIFAPDPEIALAELLTSLGEPPTEMETLEQTYAAERAPIDAFRIVPLVHISESFGLSPQVRDWMAPRWGGWRLEDVWLGPTQSAAGTAP